MKSDKEKIIDEFYKVKSLGYIQSNRKNNTGIGKTFEDYIGVVENNRDEADLYGYEIKAHRKSASSYITLFTKIPTFPVNAASYLKDKFGVQDNKNPSLKKIHTSIFANKFNNYDRRYSFRLINDSNGYIKIGVYDIVTKDLIDEEVGYTYEVLDEILHKKLDKLLYVIAENEYRNHDEYFYFYRAHIYTKLCLNKFLELLDEGLIMYDIRIGSYKSGPKYGEAHDHGCGFRIKASNLKLLYDEYEMLE